MDGWKGITYGVIDDDDDEEDETSKSRVVLIDTPTLFVVYSTVCIGEFFCLVHIGMAYKALFSLVL